MDIARASSAALGFSFLLCTIGCDNREPKAATKQPLSGYSAIIGYSANGRLKLYDGGSYRYMVATRYADNIGAEMDRKSTNAFKDELCLEALFRAEVTAEPYDFGGTPGYLLLKVEDLRPASQRDVANIRKRGTAAPDGFYCAS